MDPSARTLTIASLYCLIAGTAHALPIDGFREGSINEPARQLAPPIPVATQRHGAPGGPTWFELGPVLLGPDGYLPFDFDLSDDRSASVGDFSVEFHTGN